MKCYAWSGPRNLVIDCRSELDAAVELIRRACWDDALAELDVAVQTSQRGFPGTGPDSLVERLECRWFVAELLRLSED